jgi:hypothetical protein
MRWLQTFTGKIVDIENPTPEMIDIQDIAHALSMSCRFGGHCRDFYSVAEHSLLVETMGRPMAREIEGRKPGRERFQDKDYDRLNLILLMHDAAEAYTGDLTTPVKRTIDSFSFVKEGVCTPTMELEHRWLSAIGRAFGLGEALNDLPPVVQEADQQALSVEVVSLFNPVRLEWWTDRQRPVPGTKVDYMIMCHPPAEARRRLLDRFWILHDRLHGWPGWREAGKVQS